jgi:hypothetical protein
MIDNNMGVIGPQGRCGGPTEGVPHRVLLERLYVVFFIEPT